MPKLVPIKRTDRKTITACKLNISIRMLREVGMEPGDEVEIITEKDRLIIKRKPSIPDKSEKGE